MKTPAPLYSRLALITSVTLVIGYFVVYAWTTLELTDVEPNDTITSTLMQGIVSNINDLNIRVSNFSFSSGNVGIGTASPGANLQVNSPTGGTIRLQYTGNSGFARLTTDAANSLILDTVNSVNAVIIKDITGNVGIGGNPSAHRLFVNGGPFGVYHNQSINTPLQVVGKDSSSSDTYLGVMASNNGGDNEFLFQSDGTAKADGSWVGGGADYAEWFEKEGEIAGGALIGLNAITGKVRTWQKGDIFMGVQSLNPGFIGNNIHGAETKESDMVKTHILVALVGQVEVKSGDIVEVGRRIMTTDGQFIGLRLSNGNVFIK